MYMKKKPKPKAHGPFAYGKPNESFSDLLKESQMEEPVLKPSKWIEQGNQKQFMNFKMDHEIPIAQPLTSRKRKQNKSQLGMIEDPPKLPKI